MRCKVRALEDVGHKRLWEDMGRHGKTLEDMGEHWKTWEDMVGHWNTWEERQGCRSESSQGTCLTEQERLTILGSVEYSSEGPTPGSGEGHVWKWKRSRGGGGGTGLQQFDWLRVA